MEDLRSLEKQFMIFCSYMVNPEAIMATMEQMRGSEETVQKERAEEIYNILNGYFTKPDKFTKDIEKLDMDNKRIQLATIVGSIFFDQDNPKFKLAYRKYNQLKKRYEKFDDDLFIRTESDKPIDNGDLVFLNNMAAITADNPQEVSLLNIFNDRTFKGRVTKLYYTQPYYFEQAFCNIDVLVQDKIMTILSSDEEQNLRFSDPKRKSAYQFLEELYMISAIDKKLIKSDMKFSKDKAFESFKNLLRNREKTKTVSILLKDDTIMNAIFNYKYNNKDSLSTLKLLFVDAIYPYNDLLLKRYMQLQNRTEEGLKKDFADLMGDAGFARAYNRYDRIKIVEVLKKDSEVLLLEMESNEVSDSTITEIVNIISAYETYIDPIPEMLSGPDIHGYMRKIYEYINTHDLYENTEIQEAIDSYFIRRIHSEFIESTSLTKNVNRMESTNIITHYDIWFEINKLFKLFKNETIEKVYLKFPDITYEFEPFGKMDTSSRTMLRSEMQSLSQTSIGVDMSLERIKSIDVYLYREYLGIFRQLIDTDAQIDLGEEVVNKSLFGKSTVTRDPNALYEEDMDKIKNMMAVYITNVYLLKKGEDIFLERFSKVAPPMLRDLYTMKKTNKTVRKHIQMTHNDYLLDLFALSRSDMEQMHKSITTYTENFFTKGLKETADKYIKLINHVL